MTKGDDVRSGVREFILQNFLVGESPEALQDSTLLISTGIISSLAMVETVAFLEDRYAVVLRQEDLTPDRLDSVDRIVELVAELRAKEVPQ